MSSLRFTWRDAVEEDLILADSWLDNDARALTGFDDEGWREHYDYIRSDESYILGENAWYKLISENSVPVAIMFLCLYEGLLTVSEFLVAPEERNRGIGSAALSELLNNPLEIINKGFIRSDAVIFPNNILSKKSFERAGYRYESTHPDGDAEYYVWTPDTVAGGESHK